MLIGVYSRFDRLRASRSLILAAVTHPYFKMRWITDADDRLRATKILQEEISGSEALDAAIVHTTSESVSSSFF